MCCVRHQVRGKAHLCAPDRRQATNVDTRGRSTRHEMPQQHARRGRRACVCACACWGANLRQNVCRMPWVRLCYGCAAAASIAYTRLPFCNLFASARVMRRVLAFRCDDEDENDLRRRWRERSTTAKARRIGDENDLRRRRRERSTTAKARTQLFASARVNIARSFLM